MAVPCVAEADGRVVAYIRGLRFSSLEGIPGTLAPPYRLVHELTLRPFAPAEPAELAERVVFVGNDRGHAAQPEEAGVRCTRVSSPSQVNAARPGTVLVAAPPKADESPQDTALRNASTLVGTARALAESPRPVRLWSLTRAVRAGRELAHAPLFGIGRIIAGEHPELWGGTLDITAEPTGERLLHLLRTGMGEDVIVVTPEGDMVPRLTPIERDPDWPATKCRPDGTYLITGGLGGLGLEVAPWLIGRCVRRLVLISRRGPSPRHDWDTVSDALLARRIEAVRGLEALVATVTVLALDIADADRVAAAQPEHRGDRLTPPRRCPRR